MFYLFYTFSAYCINHIWLHWVFVVGLLTRMKNWTSCWYLKEDETIIIAPIFISKQNEYFHVPTVHFSAILCPLVPWLIVSPWELYTTSEIRPCIMWFLQGSLSEIQDLLTLFKYHIGCKLIPFHNHTGQRMKVWWRTSFYQHFPAVYNNNS